MFCANRLVYITIGILLLFGCESKNDPENALIIENVHMRALPPERSTAAVYLSLRNLTDQDHVLTYIHSPHAEAVEVHRSFYEEGMMRMRPVRHVSIAASETLHFKPGGYHLMVMGLDTAFEPGDSYPLTIEFGSGVVSEVSVEVR